MAHVESTILTIVIGAADVVTPGPDPDRGHFIGD